MGFVNKVFDYFMKDNEEEEFNGLRIVKPQMAKGNHLDILVYSPKCFSDAKDIADTLMEDKAVIVSFEIIDIGVRNRIFDYLNGVAYIYEASVSCVSNDVLLYTPSRVHVEKTSERKFKTSWLD